MPESGVIFTLKNNSAKKKNYCTLTKVTPFVFSRDIFLAKSLKTKKPRHLFEALSEGGAETILLANMLPLTSGSL